MTAFERFLEDALAGLEAAGHRRWLPAMSSGQGTRVVVAGREVLNFSSNDYLGLACHPRLRGAAAAAIAAHGTGSGASRLLSGSLPEHVCLEQSLASFKGTEAALGFSSGYAAALGAIPALVGPGDAIFIDRLAHACLVDGARLSRATIRTFPHNDPARLEARLARWRASHPRARALIAAESVYSMDGDLAPLAALVEIKDRHGAWLLLDEAHGVGILGRQGRGLADATGLGHRIEVQMGTLGKALGSSGAYICGSNALRDFLVNRARSFIYSTAPPPAAAAAATAAIELLETGAPVNALRNVIAAATRALGRPPSATPILPIILGEAPRALAAATALLERGILAPAIRFPSVPRRLARLRISLSAPHTHHDISILANALAEVLD